MAQAGTTPDWENALRPWRLISALTAIAQLPLMAAALVGLFVVDEANRVWAYAAAGAFLALEIVKWAVEREALRRAPSVPSEQIYASVPLNRQQRRLVGHSLVLSPLLVVLLTTVIARDSDVDVAVVIVVIAIAVSGTVPLYRVWRHNSWLAISRLPARPRRSVDTAPRP